MTDWTLSRIMKLAVFPTIKTDESADRYVSVALSYNSSPWRHDQDLPAVASRVVILAT